MKGKQSSKPMSVNDSNQSNVGLVDLAEALDSQGMIGFTRAFVQDLKKGLSHSTPEHLPWMEQLSKTCLLYTSPSPRDKRQSRMPSSA